MPQVEHLDQTGDWPMDIFNKALEVGLVNLNVPEEYGGLGASVLEECIVGMEFAYGCSGIGTALMVNQLATLPMNIAASDEQKAKYFTRLEDQGKIMSYCVTEPDAGSDVSGMKTTAIRRGDKYILNGAKTWITGGPVARYFTVFAKTDPEAGHKGMSCFIVEAASGKASASASRWRRWANTRRRPPWFSWKMWKCRPKICSAVKATAL